jgi:hypothetical protein
MSPPPVFIHAWWRSASTYVWSKFRADPRNRCFNEPLHEKISQLRESELGEFSADLLRALHHPPLQDHPFAEFGPLLRAGALPYTPDLAYARYLLKPGEADAGLHAYLKSLIDSAALAAQRAVLCFCRSQMRSAWMRANFQALHVAQVRDPAAQFASFGVARYFPSRMVTIAANLCQRYPDAFLHTPELRRQVMAGSPSAALPYRETIDVFALLWLASVLQAVGFADFVLDVDCLSDRPEARREATDWFHSQRCVIQFDDCNVPRPPGGPAAEEMRKAMERAAAALREHAGALAIFEPARVAAVLERLSPTTRASVELALA